MNEGAGRLGADDHGLRRPVDPDRRHRVRQPHPVLPRVPRGRVDRQPDPEPGGPENSLTLWGDQTDYPSETFCDYGAAYTFMEYLAQRYGRLHVRPAPRRPRTGSTRWRAPGRGGLTREAGRPRHPWATMVAIDGALDDGWDARRRRARRTSGRRRSTPRSVGTTWRRTRDRVCRRTAPTTSGCVTAPAPTSTSARSRHRVRRRERAAVAARRVAGRRQPAAGGRARPCTPAWATTSTARS